MKGKSGKMAITTNKIIAIWAQSLAIAHENPSLLIERAGSAELCTAISDVCAARCTVSAAAERLLELIRNRADAPKVAVDYLEEKNGIGFKCDCKYHSNPKFIHPECREQRHRYFQAQEKLIEYGFQFTDWIPLCYKVLDSL